MNSFLTEKNNFLIDGQFENNIDSSGNINVSTQPANINQEYLAIPLQVYVYDQEKIKSLYDVSITEFSLPVTKKEELEQVQAVLEETIQSFSESSLESDLLAAKDIIIGLRIKLQEGTDESDFSNTFPYLKK